MNDSLRSGISYFFSGEASLLCVGVGIIEMYEIFYTIIMNRNVEVSFIKVRRFTHFLYR